MRITTTMLLVGAVFCSTIQAREARTERTPYVQNVNAIFDELQLAFDTKNFAVIEKLLTNASSIAAADGNVEDLASSYTELTDFYVARGAYDKAQKYFDLSFPAYEQLAKAPEALSFYIRQIENEAEMYAQKGEAEKGLQRLQTHLPAVEAKLLRLQHHADFKDAWSEYVDLINSGFSMTLNERKQGKTASKIEPSEPLAKNLQQLMQHFIEVKKKLNVKERECDPITSFGHYLAPELEAFEILLKYCQQSSPNSFDYRRLAATYIAQQRYSEAIEIYKSILSGKFRVEYGLNSSYQVDLADLYLKNNEPEQAKAAFDKVLSQFLVSEKQLVFTRTKNIEAAYALARLGNYYIQTNQRMMYKQFFDQRMKLWASKPAAQARILAVRANIEFEAGDMARAEVYALAALGKTTKSSDDRFERNRSMMLLIDIYTKQGNIPKAAQFYEQYLSEEADFLDFNLPSYVEWATKQHLEQKALSMIEKRLQTQSGEDLVAIPMLKRRLTVPLMDLFKQQGAAKPLEKAHQFFNEKGDWIN